MYSLIRREMWLPLIEKAFLKVMGESYDFPGSNSHVDLHTLTGWIPEGINTSVPWFDGMRTWELLIKGQPYGTCLVTIGSRHDLPEENNAGLVPGHAYAVLDVKFVCGQRLLQVKNPWSHKRWRGPFSPEDSQR